jgi:hypothetical protein
VSVVALAGILVARPALADTATLTSAADNTLFETTDGSLSNGAGGFMFAGMTANGVRRRALVRFDLTSIPPGAQVTAATLTLTMTENVSGPSVVGVRPVLDSWGEGTSDSGGSATTGGGAGAPSTANDATWLHRFFPNVLWGSAGGDFSSTVSATQTVNTVGSYSWSGTQLSSDVQAWVQNPATNNGWILLGDESSVRTAKRFNTRENTNPTTRPVLTVEFTPAPTVPVPPWATAMLGLLLAGGGFLASRRYAGSHAYGKGVRCPSD